MLCMVTLRYAWFMTSPHPLRPLAPRADVRVVRASGSIRVEGVVLSQKVGARQIAKGKPFTLGQWITKEIDQVL